MQHLAQVKENRDLLRPIVSTISLYSLQNIALCGERDNGNTSLNYNKNEQNNLVANQEKNVKALLRFRIESDDLILR